MRILLPRLVHSSRQATPTVPSSSDPLAAAARAARLHPGPRGRISRVVVPRALLVTLLLVLAGCSTSVVNNGGTASTGTTTSQSTGSQTGGTQAGGSGSGSTGAGATSATATASAAMSPPSHPPVVPAGTVIGPSMAQVGDMLLVAGEGPNDTLAIKYQGVGAQIWLTETVAGPGTTFSRPQVVQLQATTSSRPVIKGPYVIGVAAQGPNNSLDFYWQTMDRISSLPWSQEVVAGPGTIYSGVSIAQFGDDVGIAAQGANHTLDFWSQQVGASGWNFYPNLTAGTGVAVGGTPSLASLANNMVGVAFLQANAATNILYLSMQNISSLGQRWTTYPVEITGNAPSSSPSMVQLANGVIGIAVQSPVSLQFLEDTSGLSNLWSFTQVDTGILSAPSLVQLANGVLGMTATGANQTLNFYWEVNGTWHGEPLNEPGMDVAQPALALVTSPSGTPLVATVSESASDAVIFYWQPQGASDWSGFYLGTGGFV